MRRNAPAPTMFPETVPVPVAAKLVPAARLTDDESSEPFKDKAPAWTTVEPV